MLFMAALSLVALQACQKEEDTPVTNVVETGTCGAQGSNLTWTLNADGTLTIRGKGAMEDYDYDGETEPPWTDYRGYISTVVIQDGVTSIGNYAFFNYWDLTSVTIPNTVTSIGESAFWQCDLTSVTIPEGVTSIGAGAFCYCGELTSITFPNSVTNIGEYAFNGCSNLTAITIPESVTNIEEGVFIFCSRLTSITIPEGVASIGSDAFRDCTSLTRIAVKAPIPPAIDSGEFGGSFSGVDTFVPVYVPANSINAYQNSAWGQYFNNIQPISY